MIVGTAGHIDHGKTALVKALTGVDADRLKEEKQRGLTIELGFAYKPLADGEILGFVDVPGHEKFVHNMLSGATGIDFVMLIVAADDGPMPQTHEHLAIIDLLGINKGIVALTKTDLVDSTRVEKVTGVIKDMLKSTGLIDSPVIPVSAITNQGIDELDRYLVKQAGMMPARKQSGYFRLAVDRSFSLTGAGTVVTGTAYSGVVKEGEQYLVSPSNIPVKIRSIHAQNKKSKSGYAGQRCALNLTGKNLHKNDIQRGNWILAKPLHSPTARLDARLNLLESASRPIRHWTPVHFHIGANDVLGRVAILADDSIKPGASGLIQLVLEEPIIALHGDRFIIRDISAKKTLGGGRILDPLPPRRGRSRPERCHLLDIMDQDDPGNVLAEMLIQLDNGISLDNFSRAWNLTNEELDALVGQQNIKLVQHGTQQSCFSQNRWQVLRQQLLEQLSKHHQQFPDRAGARQSELNKCFPKIKAGIIEQLVDELASDKKILKKEALLHLPEHRGQIAKGDEKLWFKIRSILQSAGVKPPKLQELITESGVNEKQATVLLQKLTTAGELAQVTPKLYFLPETVYQIARNMEKYCQDNKIKDITVAQFREATGVNRNMMIDVLEYFDKTGFTLRVDKGRRIRQDATVVFGGESGAQNNE